VLANSIFARTLGYIGESGLGTKTILSLGAVGFFVPFAYGVKKGKQKK
jgi:hypothetical protein